MVGMNLSQWTSNSPTVDRQARELNQWSKPWASIGTHTKRDSLSLSLTLTQGNQQHGKSIHKISFKLIVNTILPLGICGTSDSKRD